jgi:Glycosyl hydrolases family 25
MLDLENNPSGPQCYELSQSAMVAWIVDFVDTYSGTTGRFPMIYTTNNWWSTCTGNYNGFANYCPLVLAKYAASPGTVPGGWPSYTIWQNSEHYLYGGDSDIFNGGEDGLLALAAGTHVETSPFQSVSGPETQKVVLESIQDTLSNHVNTISINLTLPSFTDDPWHSSQSPTFRDGSISLLCICPGAAGATQTILPWRLANTITATNAYMRHGTRPDPTTGGTVDFYAGVGAGGVHMSGDSDDGHTDATCAVGCIAWWSYGKLVRGRDANLQVVIPPPGNLYRKITGPNEGLRSGGMDAKCIGTGAPEDFRCVAGGRECVYAGGPCVVVFSAFPGQPDYSITAACAAAFYNDEKEGTAGLCVGDMLSVTDLTQIVEYSQLYT